MCVVTALAYTMISTWYVAETIVLNQEKPLFSAKEWSKIIQSSAISVVCGILAWTAEFSVKVSLLLFFKQLVDRLPRLTLYVKFVMACTIVVWAVLICEPFMVCAHFGVSSRSKSPMYQIFPQNALIGRGC